MKKISQIIFALTFTYLMGSNPGYTTTHIITAYSTPTEKFSPAIINAFCGDTIKWVLGNGTHTTASTTIPNGAATWNSPTITTSGFKYVVSVPGTYNYTCHPATGGHMPAAIIVTCATGIFSKVHENVSVIYPNPFSDKITIEIPSAEIIAVYTLTGQKIKSVIMKNGQSKNEMYVADLPKGIYIVKIYDGVKNHTKKIVKQE